MITVYYTINSPNPRMYQDYQDCLVFILIAVLTRDQQVQNKMHIFLLSKWHSLKVISERETKVRNGMALVECNFHRKAFRAMEEQSWKPPRFCWSRNF